MSKLKYGGGLKKTTKEKTGGDGGRGEDTGSNLPEVSEPGGGRLLQKKDTASVKRSRCGRLEVQLLLSLCSSSPTRASSSRLLLPRTPCSPSLLPLFVALRPSEEREKKDQAGLRLCVSLLAGVSTNARSIN